MSRIGLLMLVVLAGCATGSVSPAQDASPQGSGEAVAQEKRAETDLVAPGYGTLRQDEFTVSLRSGALLIKVTPLTESVIRLAAPDTYDRLHALAESRRSEAAAATLGVEPELFLVSFFSYEPNVEFQPEDLQLVQRGRLLRARTVLPVTPGWGKQRLQQQETQIAVYAFGEPIDYEQLLVVRYGLEESGGWDRIIRVLEVERAKVRARTPAGSGGGPEAEPDSGSGR